MPDYNKMNDWELFSWFWALHRGFREQVYKDFSTHLEPALWADV